MSYQRFINLLELLSGKLVAKIGQVILSKDLINKECNSSLLSKDNRKCVYKGKSWNKYLIYEVKFSKCDAVI